MPERVVFLSPGFLGFTSFGDTSYFKDVEQALKSSLARRDAPARIIVCPTEPTGSIVRRADRLRHHVLAQCDARRDMLHFVGHSTGGLDIRLLLAPGVRIGGGAGFEFIAENARSAISVVSPHHGAPAASMFATAKGSALLLVIASLASTGRLRAARNAASSATSLLAQFGDRVLGTGNRIDELVASLSRRIRFEGEDAVWKYLEDIKEDRGALLQLTPEAAHLFSATVRDRSSVAYGCVVAGTLPPDRSLTRGVALNPVRSASEALYSVLYSATSAENASYPYPEPTAALRKSLEAGLGFEVGPETNDGIVPTLSQLHGRLIHAACADHMDVVGHYSRAPEGTGDWLPSGAEFTPGRFEALWDAVAEAIVEAE